MIARGQASAGRLALVLAPLILAAGVLSGRLSQSGPGNGWFDALVKPGFYPPPATFGIAWSVLYVLMGIALALVVAAPRSPVRRAAIAAFAVQLALNLAWSPLFFAAHRIAAALALLLAIDVAVALTLVLFRRVRAAAGWLLAPYLAWVLFATALNLAILRLNPGA